jgi:hypothetical protein
VSGRKGRDTIDAAKMLSTTPSRDIAVNSFAFGSSTPRDGDVGVLFELTIVGDVPACPVFALSRLYHKRHKSSECHFEQEVLLPGRGRLTYTHGTTRRELIESGKVSRTLHIVPVTVSRA